MSKNIQTAHATGEGTRKAIVNRNQPPPSRYHFLQWLANRHVGWVSLMQYKAIPAFRLPNWMFFVHPRLVHGSLCTLLHSCCGHDSSAIKGLIPWCCTVICQPFMQLRENIYQRFHGTKTFQQNSQPTQVLKAVKHSFCTKIRNNCYVYYSL